MGVAVFDSFARFVASPEGCRAERWELEQLAAIPFPGEPAVGTYSALLAALRTFRDAPAPRTHEPGGKIAGPDRAA